jgi:hypothetical protein
MDQWPVASGQWPVKISNEVDDRVELLTTGH